DYHHGQHATIQPVNENHGAAQSAPVSTIVKPGASRVLLVLAVAGGGKGELVKNLFARFPSAGIKHLHMSSLLPKIEPGGLVDDATVISCFNAAFEGAVATDAPIVIEGYCRTAAQVDAFMLKAAELGVEDDICVVHLNVSTDTAVQRQVQRGIEERGKAGARTDIPSTDQELLVLAQKRASLEGEKLAEVLNAFCGHRFHVYRIDAEQPSALVAKEVLRHCRWGYPSITGRVASRLAEASESPPAGLFLDGDGRVRFFSTADA
ncbi:MAG: adenylate kinase, partial [Candidatus Parcubacteria bacterium]